MPKTDRNRIATLERQVAAQRADLTELRRLLGHVNELIAEAGLNPQPSLTEVVATRIPRATTLPTEARSTGLNGRTPTRRDIQDLGGDQTRGQPGARR